MKYTHDMIETCIQGDLDTAMRIITDLANDDYTVDNLKTDLAEVWIGLIHWKNISRQKIEVGEE